MESKRIFLVNQTDESQRYGVGKYLSEIIYEVKARQGVYSLIVITIGVFGITKPEEIREDNVSYFNIPKPYFLGTSIHSLSNQFSKAIFCVLTDFFIIRSTDLFHFNSNMQYFLIKDIKEKTTAKIIYTVHVSLWKVFFNNNFDNFFLEWNNETSISRSIRNIKAEVKSCELSDRVICLSDGMKKDVLELYKIPESKIKKVENGIHIKDYENFDKKELIEIRSKLKVASKEFVFMYIGRLNAQKGVIQLIESIKRVIHEENSNIKLVLVGDGDLNSSLLENCKGIEQNIVFTGYVQPNRINYYYKLADALVFPSLNEQSSYVMLEAMSNKVPMIVTESDTFEMLKDEFSCLKVYCSNTEIDIDSFVKKIKLLINNNSLRSNIANNAYLLYKKAYSSSKMFVNTYES
ncbi:hypothetical protein BFR04_06830 [Gaetbulibacter sp. 4G1]|nr:glycosyltransferase family 4 protein [Gaetbulibacter sp. 4G1]PIA79227.1 hypothetical protein BFR04_06830 [Gaetbulibacter sp. 4G1]